MNEESKVQASARVYLTLDVGVGGVWGPDCPIGQVQVQAASEAKDRIAALFSKSGMILKYSNPKVIITLTEKTDV